MYGMHYRGGGGCPPARVPKAAGSRVWPVNDFSHGIMKNPDKVNNSGLEKPGRHL